MQDDRATARVTEFAAALLALKERTPHSYETLAARLDISRSALHRYCSGRAVPPDFEVVTRLARQVRADRAKLTELHRLWVLASEPRTSAPEPEPVDADEAPSPETATPEKEEVPAVVAVGTGARRRHRAVAAAFLGLVALAAVLVWNGRGDEAPETVADTRPLFSDACREPVREGQSDQCVRQVQQLLAETGVTIGIDGVFGPETLRRVEAFQLRVGLNVDGIVDDDTKRALYDEDVSLRSWSEKRVADRIREVFAEKPDTAVRIARCQSFLDPLHITLNTNGTRNWGVFQISDARLRDLRGTPEKAMDPEWNIRAAQRLWAQDEDFSDWPHCAAAAEDHPADENGDAA